MCVIIHKPKGAKISEETLIKCWEKNGDGAGIALKGETGWSVKKGIMVKDEFLKEILPYTDEQHEFVAHLRIKSKGIISSELTHPFNFSNKKETRFLFHNGTVKFLKTGDNSDSCFLAENILKHLSSESADKVLKNLSQDDNGRFITLINDEIYRYSDKESSVEDGVWFSNLRFKTYYTTTTYSENYYPGNWTRDSKITPTSKEAPIAPKLLNAPKSERKERFFGLIAYFYANKTKSNFDEKFTKDFVEEKGLAFTKESSLSCISHLCEKYSATKDFDKEPIIEYLASLN